LSITAFAKKGYASTAIAGIFSGPLLTFLLGFGVTCVLNSFAGEYDFTIFKFEGEAYDQISDSIVVGVIVMAIVYMVWIFCRILRNK
jgi:Ca2+/Na+ antiporter